MTHVGTSPHELEGNLNFFEHGLSPYWALTSLLINGYDGSSDELETTIDGETWTLQLFYQKGGIAPRLEDDVGSDRLYEPRIKARGDGERKASYHFRPRFEEMRHYESGDRISSPCDRSSMPDEGVNIFVQGSNVEPKTYETLLPQFVQFLAGEVGRRFNTEYFAPTDIHETSTVHAYERYLRLRRSMMQKIIGTGGVIQKIHHLLLDEKGVKYELSVDNEDVVGKMHKLPLERSAARELPVGNRGKQIKSYLLQNPDSVDEADPTYHPKLGLLFNKKLDGSAIQWHELDDLQHELDETLINLLYWSGVPTDPDHTTFVPDDHFEATAYDGPTLRLYDDPTPQLEASQEALLVCQLRELTDADMEHLEVMTDGGEMHYEDIVDESGTSISTLYRTLQRCDALLESDNGVVQWRSKKVHQDIQAVVERVEGTVEAAADSAARLLGMDPQQLREKGSAFQSWLNRYGAELIEAGERGHPGRIKIEAVLSRFRAGSGEYIGKVLDYLEVCWARAGFDESLDGTVVEYNTGDGYDQIVLGSSRDARLR